MPRWIPQFGRHKPPGRQAESDAGGTSSGPGHTLELLVVAGPDAGSRFTVERGAIRIGRGAPQQARAGAIGLRDPSVSPHHATILANERESLIVHSGGAASPPLLNGRAVDRAPIRAGDRIQIGDTGLEVRSRAGISLSGLLTIPHELRAGLGTGRHETATTEIRHAMPPRAALVVLRGIDDLAGRRLPLLARTNRLGRHPDNEIVLPEQGVSRFHAELLWENGQLIFAHKSQVNPSYVNGELVEDRVALCGGETIQLADRVALRIEIDDPDAAARAGDAAPAPEHAASHPPSLRELMEEKLRRDAEIERDFSFTGSFLDLDVVDSHGLKVAAKRPEYIIVSFERFRGFASRVVQEHEGQVLNSNGDELMCFFTDPEKAVRAAAALLERLGEFNARENLLGLPFRVRQGIHSGSSLVDRVRGVAYSPVLDVAGRLQKFAPVDGLLVSAETLALLPLVMRFAPAEEVGKERIAAHRFEALTGA